MHVCVCVCVDVCMCSRVCVDVCMCVDVLCTCTCWSVIIYCFLFCFCHQSVSGDLDPSQPLSSLHLVELSAVTPSGQDTIEAEMKAFADHLKPYPLPLTSKNRVLAFFSHPPP